MDTQNAVSVYTISKVITDIDELWGNNEYGNMLTAHTDGKVRLWDTRDSSKSNSGTNELSNGVKLTFAVKDDFNWISQVKFPLSQCLFIVIHIISQVRAIPGNGHQFATSNYNGVIRLWDTRNANVPLVTIDAHEGKALCLDLLTDSRDYTNSNNDDSGMELEKKQERSIRIISGGSDCHIRATNIQ
jgi:WD40 repeat protein